MKLSLALTAARPRGGVITAHRWRILSPRGSKKGKDKTRGRFFIPRTNISLDAFPFPSSVIQVPLLPISNPTLFPSTLFGGGSVCLWLEPLFSPPPSSSFPSHQAVLHAITLKPPSLLFSLSPVACKVEEKRREIQRKIWIQKLICFIDFLLIHTLESLNVLGQYIGRIPHYYTRGFSSLRIGEGGGGGLKGRLDDALLQGRKRKEKKKEGTDSLSLSQHFLQKVELKIAP